MSIFEQLRAFSVDTNEKKIHGIKSGIVWGHAKNTNSIYPLLYISKPKHISEEHYRELLDAIEIEFIKKEK